jgi:hypothetical protein
LDAEDAGPTGFDGVGTGGVTTRELAAFAGVAPLEPALREPLAALREPLAALREPEALPGPFEDATARLDVAPIVVIWYRHVRDLGLPHHVIQNLM